MDKVALIQNQINEALKGHDLERLKVLKVLLAKIKNRQIELRGQNKPFEDEDFSGVVLGEIKSRHESIEAFKAGKRDDLVQKEEQELAVLSEFAPKLLGREEIESQVKQVISTLSKESTPNFGVVMGQVMPSLKGKADGSLVSQVVQEVLGL